MKEQKLRILYFYQYFSTPKGSWGTRVYEFAKKWVEQGHEVTVVTSVYAKSDLKAKGIVDTQIIEGIRVKIINVYVDNKRSLIRRMFGFAQYATLACWFALTIRCNVVISSSGPITVGIPGLLSSWTRRKKLVFEARDLWPDGAIELGLIKNGFVRSFGHWLARSCYRSSRLIVGLSPGIRDFIKARFPSKKVVSITNSANLELFGGALELPADTELIPNNYAIYTGNIGRVNNSYWLYHAAEHLKKKGRSDIKVLLIGEGQQREELCNLAEGNGISNFIRLPLMPKESLVPYLQNAIVSLVPLDDAPILNTSSPNKFFESLAAGVPIVQTTTGWINEYLVENKVGFTLDPNDSESLADLLIDLVDNPDQLMEMKSRASECARRDFDQTQLSQEYLKNLKEVVYG